MWRRSSTPEIRSVRRAAAGPARGRRPAPLPEDVHAHCRAAIPAAAGGGRTGRRTALAVACGIGLTARHERPPRSSQPDTHAGGRALDARLGGELRGRDGDRPLSRHRHSCGAGGLPALCLRGPVPAAHARAGAAAGRADEHAEALRAARRVPHGRRDLLVLRHGPHPGRRSDGHRLSEPGAGDGRGRALLLRAAGAAADPLRWRWLWWGR